MPADGDSNVKEDGTSELSLSAAHAFGTKMLSDEMATLQVRIGISVAGRT